MSRRNSPRRYRTSWPCLQRPDKRTRELFIRGTGVRTSAIWYDRYISRMTPQQIAQNRDLPMAAILEALAYCQDRWEVICAEKDYVARAFSS